VLHILAFYLGIKKMSFGLMKLMEISFIFHGSHGNPVVHIMKVRKLRRVLLTDKYIIFQINKKFI